MGFELQECCEYFVGKLAVIHGFIVVLCEDISKHSNQQYERHSLGSNIYHNSYLVLLGRFEINDLPRSRLSLLTRYHINFQYAKVKRASLNSAFTLQLI